MCLLIGTFLTNALSVHREWGFADRDSRLEHPSPPTYKGPFIQSREIVGRCYVNA